MTIEVSKQTVAVDGITDITVSDIVADETNGGYVRRILFYTDPATVSNRTATIELVLTSEDDETLKMHTPELEY